LQVVSRVSFGQLSAVTTGLATPLKFRPADYEGPELPHPPNGEPETVRYRVAYSAFWWNCVFVKSEALDARCPVTCSGTQGAAAGCAEGSTSAEDAMKRLRVHFDEGSVLNYLGTLTESPEAKAMIQPYFGGQPRVDRGPGN
jgi:hypothetical protein